MQRPNTMTGIDHLKLAASDLQTTKDFYCDVLGFEYLPQFDHKTAEGDFFALMMRFQHIVKPTGSTTPILVEVRRNGKQAKAQEGWDPITFGVPSKKDLEEWQAWFRSKNVQCSRVFTGLKGWVVCALDPDGKIVRVYCEETHEWTTDFDRDDFWLPQTFQ